MSSYNMSPPLKLPDKAKLGLGLHPHAFYRSHETHHQAGPHGIPGAPMGKPSLQPEKRKDQHEKKQTCVSQVPGGDRDGTAEAAAGP